MRRAILFFLVCFCIQLSFAEKILLDSLKFNNGYIHTQGAVLHNGVCEFDLKDTLYIISNTFEQDYDNFMDTGFYDLSSLVQKLRTLYTNKDQHGKWYKLVYSGYTPTTLTLYSDLDTIQYSTTPYPQLYTGTVRDTLYGSSNIKCGVEIRELFNNVSIGTLYYDYTNYSNIVIIPTEFAYSVYQELGELLLPYISIMLRIEKGIIRQIEFRHVSYSFYNRQLLSGVLLW